MKLTAKKVNEIFMDCLFRDDEIKDGKPIVPMEAVEGLTGSFGFHKERLLGYATEIKSLLAQLPEEFSKGGGWSFLNMCINKDGNRWGEHRSIEELVCLGIGIKSVKCCAPREMWSILPGGMPYYKIMEETDDSQGSQAEEKSND